MDAGKAIKGADTPSQVYAQRLRELNLLQAAEQRREAWLGYSKLTVAAVTLICAVLFLHYLRAFEFLLLPVCAFMVLAVLHEKAIRSLRHRSRAITFYERGLARLEDRWSG